VIPLWQDKVTKKWEILISRNAGTAIWTDFDNEGKQDPRQLAIKTLHDFTRARYNEKNAPLSSAIDLIQYGQHFWFVPVVSRVEDKAMRMARNQEKRDFVWVPIDKFLALETIHDPRQRKSGRITIDHNLREAMRILWPDVSKKLPK
jgi:hypothetical protein